MNLGKWEVPHRKGRLESDRRVGEYLRMNTKCHYEVIVQDGAIIVKKGQAEARFPSDTEGDWKRKVLDWIGADLDQQFPQEEDGKQIADTPPLWEP